MFRSYPEINSLNHNKKIQQHLKYNPYAQESSYIYQIKYDGSNIQLVFEPGKYVQIGKRSGILPEGENFNGILDIIDRYKDLIEYFESYCEMTGNYVNLYSEIFGQGIQKRIDYGPDKYLKFFDVAINHKMLTYPEVKDKFTYLVDNYYVETYGPVSFDEIFNLEVPERNEGIVIKSCEMADRNERPLVLKLKDEKFSEKGGKPNKPKKEIDPIVEYAKEQFLSYINENRVKSVFSKEGEIDDDNQIGKYIELIIKDAINDFEKEEDTSYLSKDQFKQVKKSASKEVVLILKKYL